MKENKIIVVALVLATISLIFSTISITFVNFYLTKLKNLSKIEVEVENLSKKVSPYTAPEVEPLKVGDVAPNFKLRDIDGEENELRKLRGKNVVLFAWVIEDKFCKKLLVELQKFYEDYKNLKDLKILTVTRLNYPQEKPIIKDFVDEKNLTVKILIDDTKFGEDYRVSKAPYLWIIDKKGIIKGVYQGKQKIKSIKRILINEGLVKK
jgi:peroxiredoxin